MSLLEAQIAQWREFLRRRAAIQGADVEELEDHLRNQVTTLTDRGLDDEEAAAAAAIEVAGCIEFDAVGHAGLRAV